MFNSLEKIKELTQKIQKLLWSWIYQNNAKFCAKIDKDNLKLKKES